MEAKLDAASRPLGVSRLGWPNLVPKDPNCPSFWGGPRRVDWPCSHRAQVDVPGSSGRVAACSLHVPLVCSLMGTDHPGCCSPLCKAGSGFVGGGSVPEGEGSSLLNREGCLVLLFFFFGVHFSPFFFNLSASIFILITSYPFIFFRPAGIPHPICFQGSRRDAITFLNG